MAFASPLSTTDRQIQHAVRNEHNRLYKTIATTQPWLPQTGSLLYTPSSILRTTSSGMSFCLWPLFWTERHDQVHFFEQHALTGTLHLSIWDHFLNDSWTPLPSAHVLQYTMIMATMIYGDWEISSISHPGQFLSNWTTFSTTAAVVCEKVHIRR